MRQRVWDLPTRLFHWMLAGSFLSAFTIALALGERSPVFPIHALLGLVAVLLVGFRLVWGLVGSRWSRFGAFAWGGLFGYLREAVAGAPDRWVGHNPATSWLAVVMFACVVGLGATGIAMGRGYDQAREAHELLAWTLVGAAAFHVAGIVLHTIRHRDAIALGMVDGRKEVAGTGAAIPSSRPLAGFALLALVGAWAFALARGLDPASHRLTVPGVGTLEIGEAGGDDDAEDERE